MKTHMYFNRRNFIKTSAVLAAGLTFYPSLKGMAKQNEYGYPIRLGGPLQGDFSDPAEWIKAARNLGYSALYCPVQPGASKELIRSFRTQAKNSNIIIAEVGAWSNPLDPDETTRREAVNKNIEALRLADEVGAACCVNISGARGKIWDGPYRDNYAADTKDLIVETVRNIIDSVKPSTAFYSLEPMPYMLPDSPDSCLELIKAVNRKQFGVHLDPVNMISSPQRYFNNGNFLEECFTKLGPYIKSIHAKDILLMPELIVHLEERRPGLGNLDYRTFLREACRLKDVPFMLEHLNTQEDYKLAADYVRETGRKTGVAFV